MTSETLKDDAATFLEDADDLAGLSKRDLQKRAFRLKQELGARYEFSVEGYEDDYEARLEPTDDGAEARFVVDRRGDETEVSAFVLRDGEAVVNEVEEFRS